MVKRHTAPKLAGPGDPIYSSGWGTFQTLGDLKRKLESAGLTVSPETQALIDKLKASSASKTNEGSEQ